MAENTDDNPLENPANTQSENSPDKIIPTEDIDTINPNQETENMEVHKHPHHVTHKKKLGEYLLEFLMLFLAVFLGFVAESYHVHLVNKKIEKRNIESFIANIQKDSNNLIVSIFLNIESFIANIQKDSNNLIVSIKGCQDKIKLIDSLSEIQGEKNDTSFQKQFFIYARKLIYYEGYNPDESAFLQMQSSGTLRLIARQNITDSILKYQTQNSSIKKQQETVNKYFDFALENLIPITDLRKSTLSFNGNNQQMQNYINWKIAEKRSSGFYINLLNKQLLYTKQLLPFLKKEYNINE